MSTDLRTGRPKSCGSRRRAAMSRSLRGPRASGSSGADLSILKLFPARPTPNYAPVRPVRLDANGCGYRLAMSAFPATPELGAYRTAFEQAKDLTVGAEEELLLLDPRTFQLCPMGSAV